jgi:hypothetical protein
MKPAALLLAALWLPATLHCQLERLGFDAIFACADQSGQAAHGDSAGCTDDGCQTIEAGQVAITKSDLDLLLPPPFVCAGVPCFQYLVPPAPAPEISAFGQDETLPLQRTWQFARRAALPARAPDTLKV